jgi:hypothetical protein
MGISFFRMPTDSDGGAPGTFFWISMEFLLQRTIYNRESTYPVQTPDMTNGLGDTRCR